jgi:hypothetical protein
VSDLIPDGTRITTRKPIPDCSNPGGHDWRTSSVCLLPTKGIHFKQNCRRCHAGRTAFAPNP